MAVMELSAQDLQSLEEQHTSGVYTKRPFVLVMGDGAKVLDASGREFIDCVAGIGTGNVGHANPTVVEAIQHQAQRLMICPESFYNDQRARLSARLVELATKSMEGMERVFLCNSGAETNEAAIKFARITTGRTGIVACMRGFHGRTFGALSATWEKKYRKPFEPLVPGFNHVPYDDLAKLDAAVSDETAAVILEVVQGEGGVRPGSTEFLQGAQKLCRERGALLIVDEVQTGLGRTGKLFGVEHYDLQPDLLTLAKSLAGGFPMGAVLIGERVGKLPPRVHGSTFGGNPLACAAALATLQVIVEGKLPERAASEGARFMENLRSLNAPQIREVRGLGLMVGVELKIKVKAVLDGLTERGVLAMPAGPNVLRFLPPLLIEPGDLDAVVAATRATLESL